MEIAIHTLRAVAYAIADPSNAFILMMIALIFYNKNKKIAAMQKMIMGESLDSPFELTISQIVIGIFAGAAASLIFTYAGLVFDENSNIYLLFMVSLFFMAFKPRFICFSYSGAVLGIASLLFKYAANALNMPQLDVINIDILTLMTLVGILHIVEGSLVMIDGSRGAIPVFTNRDNKIIGGFALKRYWALPIALLILLSATSSNLVIGQSVMIPEWRHLIKGDIIDRIVKNSVIASIALYGVIGYSGITFTKSKRAKTLTSGALIMVYGVLLTAVAQLAVLGTAYQFFILIFAAVVHEAMLRLEKHMEFTMKPKFSSSDEGIMVLAVAPKSPAFQMGIESGDLIVELNGKAIEAEEEIFNIIKGNFSSLSLKIKKPFGDLKNVNYSNMASNKRLGIVIVPREIPKDTAIVNMNDETFKEVIEKIKNKDKDEDEDKDIKQEEDKNQEQEREQEREQEQEQEQDKK
ncbi:PDZ domain-containing protein [Clostridium estertheticum]|uniref:PDZ domain-containing protein n=1 Tax=Clostridium estertheticum TaxID=238834 RepID=UPI001CF515F4|nr:PDZ domain-containing protein [Clostridium estertheticum]MCB2305251.1 PDZ domain-containing protein [Clostridium estertheticum]MCB2343479.1 PDZ domain-containing protein [Clostridium estertheticum]MCB2348399.1 PDZ domain-containing protein [Clostridium estertheticum]WAG47348.1 PDZ domain-containing protein [Clostridium estertheticum]